MKYYLFALIFLLIQDVDLFFPKITEKSAYPEAIKEFEKAFEKFYTDSIDIKKLSEEELYDYGKLLVRFYYVPETYTFKFFQYYRQLQMENIGLIKKQDPNAIKNKKIIKPGIFSSKIKSVIFERLPWEWKFHLRNKYILHVKVLSKGKYVSEDSGISYPSYGCSIICDFKGNFIGGDKINLVSGHVKTEAEISTEYLVLLFGRGSDGRPDTTTGFIKYYLKDHYLVRGLATNDEGFFPIRNNKIIDTNNSLQFNNNKIPIDEFKQKTRGFLREAGIVIPK